MSYLITRSYVISEDGIEWQSSKVPEVGDFWDDDEDDAS
jgi:hypothetical protein